ncbi:MAG: FAD-dependent oxidoreductase [Rubritepida sp.]|nr:FAD-dependent oxidoreductase [Rubritepida sp.]
MAVPYPRYRSACGWNAILPPRAPRTAPPPPGRIDSIVIGAGYAGLAAARRLAELRPDEQVLILESGQVGENASGRNAGLIVSVPHNFPASVGASAGSRPPQFEIFAEGMERFAGQVRELGIECGWNPADKLYAAATTDGEAALARNMANYARWKVGFKPLGREALRARIGTDYYRSGFASGQNVYVQPAALVRGLADTLPANVWLMEESPVLALTGDGPYVLRTEQGEFRAPRVILANNGFAKSLGFLRSRLVTIFTYAGLTPVLPAEELAKLGAPGEWGVLPAARLGTTLRRTGDGRMLVRSAYSYEHEASIEAMATMLSSLYRARYPAMASHGFEHVWGGATALTRNGAAYFGELRPGLFSAAGCNGSGILKNSVNGRLLAELALDHRSPALEKTLALTGPNWMPPEPFRRLAAMTAIRYQARRAGAER